MLTRRHLLALFAIYPQIAQPKPFTKRELLIIGGGVGALHLNRLLHPFSAHFNITVVAPNTEHLMQAGQTFVATGLMNEAQCKRSLSQLLGTTKQIVERVKHYVPQQQMVQLDNGRRIFYDELIIATGLRYDYQALTGLHAAMKQPHVCSVYENNLTHSSMRGAHKAKAWFEAIYSAAQKCDVHILFVKPAGSIKCGGVTLSLLFMLDDYLKNRAKNEGVTLNYSLTLAKPGTKLFGVELYNEVLLREAKKRAVSLLFDYEVNAVHNNSASFTHSFNKVVAYDEDFDEYTYERKRESKTVAFDFLHIVPPMQSSDALYESALSYKTGHYKGYGEVDVRTLKHLRFSNVSIIGDASGVALGKTVASALEHAKIVANNLVSTSKLAYHGYSACPIKLGYSRALDARFDYDGAINEKNSAATAETFQKQLHGDVKKYWEDLTV